MSNHYPHYFKSVKHLSHVDVYRVLDLFGVTSPPLQHAIKKLLVAGGRGSKDARSDVVEAMASCQRWLDMADEDVLDHSPGKDAGHPAPPLHRPLSRKTEWGGPL